MKAVKIVAIVLGCYVALVVAFESLIGILQPTQDTTLVISTSDEDGSSHDRVLARLESNGRLYVAANHWPRAWYNRALENPEVRIALAGETESKPFLAVPVKGQEHDRVQRDNGTGTAFRFLTGFPPRYFLRLDPR